MREAGIEQGQFDLESAFNLYHETLLRITVQQLRNQGIENATTIAPDLIQNIFLHLQKTNRPLPQTKSELLPLLARHTMREVGNYVWREAKEDPKYLHSYNIRQSHLVGLEHAQDIPVAPMQEKALRYGINLAKLINNSKLISERKKRILIARFIEEKTLDEIAKEVGLEDRRSVSVYEREALNALERDKNFINILKE